MKGKLIVISAPSGAGKTTVIKRLLSAHPGFVLSVSYTTRKRRPSEKDSVDYFFVSESSFKSKIDNKELLEWAIVYGNYYGTPLSPIENWLKKGNTVILDVDTVGAKNVKDKFPDAKLIFILPPSREELEKRLIKRGENRGKDLDTRLLSAENELRKKDLYDYCVTNDGLDDVLKEIESIINA